MKNTVVLDIEASGLEDGSYPVEIAWIGVGNNDFDSFLIKPEPHWIQWDEQAEATHGLSRSVITRVGLSAKEVVSRLDNDLINQEVFSDAPEWDGYWLDRLYNAAQKNRRWALKRVNIDFSDREWSLMPHRALSDAEHIASAIRKKLNV